MAKVNVPELFAYSTASIVAGYAGIKFVGLETFGIGGLLIGGGVIGAASCFKTGDTFEKLFENLNLKRGDAIPRLRETQETDYGKKLRFKMPPGISTEDLKKNQNAIEEHLDHKISISYKNKNAFIDVFENELVTYDFEPIETKNPAEIVIGHTIEGIKTVDLGDGEPHLLIAGESGSGKSVTLRSIITNIILTKDEKELKLHLIDLKNGAEFSIFRKCDIIKSFSRDKNEALKILSKLEKEVEKRYDLFYEKDCIDIKEYNENHKKLDYQLVIIDEFADLAEEKESISKLETLSRKARACGIHMILSTQRPCAKTINGIIKANISVVLGLKTLNEVNSRIIIDHKGLEELPGKGRGILRREGEEKEIQSMLLKPKRARDLLRPLYVDKKEEVKEEDGKVNDLNFWGDKTC